MKLGEEGETLLWERGLCALYKAGSKNTLLNRRQAVYTQLPGTAWHRDSKKIPLESSKPVSGFIFITLGS